MGLESSKVLAITELARLLKDFLPGAPHPYADSSISFPGCANSLGLGKYWAAGSKQTALSQLLRLTLENDSSKFCDLVKEIVNKGLIYRSNKKQDLTREDILHVNEVIKKIGFKIPDLWKIEFLDSLPRMVVSDTVIEIKPNQVVIDTLKKDFLEMPKVDPQKRGYDFQKFLNKFFEVYGLKPKSAYRLTGEEIDGSFDHNGNTYLLEAKYHNKPTGQSDLLAFSGKLSGKSTWARGLFISYSGFTKDGLEAFARGKSTNAIGMDSQDIWFILDGKMSLDDALHKKARRAAEKNDFFVSVFDL